MLKAMQLNKICQVILEGFGYGKASFQISQLPLSQTNSNPHSPFSASDKPNFLKSFDITDSFPSAVSLHHRFGPVQSLCVGNTFLQVTGTLELTAQCENRKDYEFELQLPCSRFLLPVGSFSISDGGDT
jgi:hypothetical protein